MYFVYVLRCSDQSLYVGQTTDVQKRVETHSAGKGAAFTSRRRPVALVYVEEHKTRADAIQRERQLKRWTRQKKEALIRGDFDLLRTLSIRRT